MYKRQELTKEEKKVFLEAAKALEKDLKTAKTKKAAEEAVREAQQNMKQLEKESDVYKRQGVDGNPP